MPGRERKGSGAWAVSIVATGMAAENQLQFRERIKGNHRHWDSEIEFTMPGR
jgi:hypothetical protein